jgi:hypothetical protein
VTPLTSILFVYFRSWGEFLHLALFDLSLKHERRAHALERDLVAHLLASWPLYQLPRIFNTLLPVGGLRLRYLFPVKVSDTTIIRLAYFMNMISYRMAD